MRGALLAGLLLAAGASAGAAQSQLLVVTGLGGEPAISARFNGWGTALVDAARTRYGLSPAQVVWLAERPEADPKRIAARSTRENVERALRQLAARATPDGRVLIVLIGHGSVAGGDARINLPGPDLTAAELGRLLAVFPTQRVTVVNAASASGDFQAALAGRNRTVITATKSGLEGNETVFGGFFVDALTGEGADRDKDGHVSMLEAFEYASTEVERHYETGNRLQTEHAVLGGNREAAAAFYLSAARPAAGASTASSDPALAPLVAERQRLEAQVEALKARKDTMDAARYQAELEDLLVKLALKAREIREKGGGK